MPSLCRLECDGQYLLNANFSYIITDPTQFDPSTPLAFAPEGIAQIYILSFGVRMLAKALATLSPTGHSITCALAASKPAL